MNIHKERAQELVNHCLRLLPPQYNSDGEVMKRSECLPLARMLARSHIMFLKRRAEIDYWEKVGEELGNCV